MAPKISASSFLEPETMTGDMAYGGMKIADGIKISGQLTLT